MVVRSLDVEKTLPLSFEFAALMFIPSSLTISDTHHYTLCTRGGLTPIDFVVSDPFSLDYLIIGECIEIWAHVDPAMAPTTVIVTAIDAEGQNATAVVNLGPKPAFVCTATGSLTALPAATVPGAVVSVTLIDYQKKDAGSVTVEITEPTVPFSGTLTLTHWGAPGVFQGNWTVPAGAGLTYTFTYLGVGADCLPVVVPATVTT
jgi:hypothetical protein